MTDIMEEDPPSGFQSSEEETTEQEEQVESLIQGRAKRSTAGLHMSALIDAAADDDLTLLFEEVEDDNEFAMDAEAAEEDDMGLDSSSDDEDDHGPNAQNDYEGEQELQKEERKKRRAQNDLRFQTLRKRVKIDPTAVSAAPAPPRPKKKSERISWLPTVEDGPTRSSSRRQTMVNKELTHARLKDSQEKRVRIIATMKEAEKRKAHLKPKEMTQEDHLREAERVERTNSKSLNRWEQTEKRKAEERRAKIEALQNRRLEGPVLSYWSGLATWVNGRLTRVGKVDIKAKPEKDETRKKKKSEKEDKTPAETHGAQDAILAPASTPAPAPGQPLELSAQPENTPAQTTAAPPDAIPTSDQKQTQGTPISASTVTPAEPTLEEANNSNEKASGPQSTIDTTETPAENEQKSTEPEAEPERVHRDSQGKLVPLVEIPAPRTQGLASEDNPKSSPGQNSAEPPSQKAVAEQTDAMDIDHARVETSAIKAEESTRPATDSTSGPASTSAITTGPTDINADTQATSGEIAQTSFASSTTALSEHATLPPAAPATTPSGPQAASANIAPTPAAPPEINAITGQPGGPISAAPAPAETSEPSVPALPGLPPPPPVIEHTGRNLTILENFDDRTAHSKKYSMYFNAKKPPRLAKISSSLCVITSLPSRYRDPETSLPYANSYAYGQIRRLMSQEYIWSSMLGCFVGPAETAARGVPDRFLDKSNVETTRVSSQEGPAGEASTDEKAKTLPNGSAAPSTPATAEPMDVDK
ncbi:uncharacterized protein N7459_005243 [Penicillium hispanicum]|uniref:uncharacterized protein n=1 Tax=Penicillium hispanicum TaxID=1080232 RepID=UPI002541BA44|nr:uncharacterized protein N7459_005243 [Penicillium hispanicum]KAJ5585443.1 hypothetical protein N7459_005243 [Penicillium hispanicum]